MIDDTLDDGSFINDWRAELERAESRRIRRRNLLCLALALGLVAAAWGVFHG
jgi:hypothetical protein